MNGSLTYRLKVHCPQQVRLDYMHGVSCFPLVHARQEFATHALLRSDMTHCVYFSKTPKPGASAHTHSEELKDWLGGINWCTGNDHQVNSCMHEPPICHASSEMSIMHSMQWRAKEALSWPCLPEMKKRIPSLRQGISVDTPRSKSNPLPHPQVAQPWWLWLHNPIGDTSMAMSMMNLIWRNAMLVPLLPALGLKVWQLLYYPWICKAWLAWCRYWQDVLIPSTKCTAVATIGKCLS